MPAGDLDWDCRETVEHMADDLFAYAGQLGRVGRRRTPTCRSRGSAVEAGPTLTISPTPGPRTRA